MLQPHLPSIFDALYTVDFDDKERIVNINSDNGETIPLDRPVACLGGVEVVYIFKIFFRRNKLKES